MSSVFPELKKNVGIQQDLYLLNELRNICRSKSQRDRLFNKTVRSGMEQPVGKRRTLKCIQYTE